MKKGWKKKRVTTKKRASGNGTPAEVPPAESPPSWPFPAQPTATIEETRREALLGFLLRGASPLQACTASGVMLQQFFDAYDTDDDFHERVEQVRDAHGWSVATMLYRTAMDGNVSAMTSWLRMRPPRDWNRDDDFTSTDDLIESLEGEQIVGAAFASREPLPPEAPRMFPPPGV